MGAVGELTEEQLEATRSPGTLINSNRHPGLAECIGNPKALAALEGDGFRRQQVSGRRSIISKPGPSPRLYWHQDCMWWDDPRAYSDYSPMIFLMYYLDDTSRENGCLRLAARQLTAAGTGSTRWARHTPRTSTGWRMSMIRASPTTPARWTCR